MHPHWSFLGWPLVSVLVSVTLAAGLIVEFPNAPAAMVYMLAVLVGGSVLWLAARWMRRVATSLVVTTARVVRRSGVLSRRSLEIRLERINELACLQSLGGRILGTGEVVVDVGGEPGIVILDHLSRPATVQRIISEQVSGWHRAARAPVLPQLLRADDTPPAGTPVVAHADTMPPGAAGRLVQLDELRRRGLITTQEYESKKEQLLREL